MARTATGSVVGDTDCPGRRHLDEEVCRATATESCARTPLCGRLARPFVSRRLVSCERERDRRPVPAEAVTAVGVRGPRPGIARPRLRRRALGRVSAGILGASRFMPSHRRPDGIRRPKLLQRGRGGASPVPIVRTGRCARPPRRTRRRCMAAPPGTRRAPRPVTPTRLPVSAPAPSAIGSRRKRPTRHRPRIASEPPPLAPAVDPDDIVLPASRQRSRRRWRASR